MSFENKRRRPDPDGWEPPAHRIMLALSAAAAIRIAIAGVVVAIVGSSGKANAQAPAAAIDRGAFIIHNGNDTVVVNRFERTADSLKGLVTIHGQGRVEFALTLGAHNAVYTMRIKVYKPGALATDAPAQIASVLMRGDSASIGIGPDIRSVGTKIGAIPSFNNAVAIWEIFTRRARTTNNTGDYTYFAMSAGVSVPATVRPMSADSLLLTIASQSVRLHVDAIGRILGGSIQGQPYTISRATAAEAEKIGFDRIPAKPAGKAN